LAARLKKTWIPACAGMTMVLLAIVSSPSFAQSSLPPAPYAYRQLDDPAKEAEAQRLMETIRCLTCQSQSIADSDAEMAGDLRHEIRTRIAAGEKPEAIRKWLIERYGDYISYSPHLSETTWPLFVVPVLLLLAALAVVASRLRRRA
jgi:cytochrome c-type biogenesis protein CcmH